MRLNRGILLAAALYLLLAGNAESQRPERPFRTSRTVDQEQCFAVNNAYCQKWLGFSFSAEQYAEAIRAPKFLDRYRWRITRERRDTAQSALVKGSIIYASSATAEPAGFISEIEGLPVPCSPAAVGIQQATVDWKNTYECDAKQGHMAFESPVIVILHPNNLTVRGIDYANTDKWDGGYLYKYSYSSCHGFHGEDFDTWNKSYFNGMFRYAARGVYGTINKNGLARYLPGSIREGIIVNNPVPMEFEIQDKIDLEAECSGLDLAALNEMEVVVKATMPETQFDHTKSGPEIAALSKDASPDRIGLAQIQFKPSPLEMTTASMKAQFGDRSCLWVNRLEVDISYPSVKVYIASEYEVGSCNYNAIMAHELVHVRDAAEILQSFKERISKALEALRAELPHRHLPVPVVDSEDVTEFDSIVAQVIKREVEAFKETLRRRTAERDATYSAIWARCPSW